MSRWVSRASASMDLDAYEEGEVYAVPGPSRARVKAEVAAGCSDASHAALKADAGRWAALALLGSQDYGGLVIELRNCVCGSTLGVEVRP